MLILHYTGMASAEAARDRLCDASSGVSCHYLVDTDGCITQMVGEELRAWHAGASCWKGETDTNSRSIGIEIHNPGHWLGYSEFPEVQMAAVAALCSDILSRHNIPPEHVLAHSDVAPGARSIRARNSTGTGFGFGASAAGWNRHHPIRNCWAHARSRACSRFWPSTAMGSR